MPRNIIKGDGGTGKLIGIKRQPKTQIVWKIAIFGAGTTSSNGEYIWDGTTLENGKPRYLASNNNYIYWASPYWWLFDYTEDRTTYVSFESLTSWEIDDALEPAPSSALSYAQNSFINGFELDGDVSQTYSRISGGNTTFTSGEPEYYVAVDGESWFAFNESISGEELYASYNGGFTWGQVAGDLPVPNISAITYSA